MIYFVVVWRSNLLYGSSKKRRFQKQRLLHGLSRQWKMTRGGRGVIKLEKWADVVYGWPLTDETVQWMSPTRVLQSDFQPNFNGEWHSSMPWGVLLELWIMLMIKYSGTTIIEYRGSPLSTIFGTWKKSYYAKFVLVGTTWPISTSTNFTT